jgi:hypothetical protein
MSSVTIDAQQWTTLINQVASLRTEVASLKRRPSTPRPVWSVKNRVSGDGITPASTILGEMVTGMPAEGAVLAVEDGTYVIDQDLTLGENTTLLSRRGVLKVKAGATLRIPGFIDAGREQIFDVEDGGAVVGDPQNVSVYPEWFGAGKGDRVADRKAFQNANNLHRYIQGSPTTKYLIDTDVTQFTKYNWHRIKHSKGNPNRGWKFGIWAGVFLREGSIISDCTISMVRTTDPKSAGRGTFVFAAGDPTSATRTTGITIYNTTFTTEDAAIVNVGERYKPLVCQSVDNIRLENVKLVGTNDAHNPILGLFAFDSNNITIDGLSGKNVFNVCTLEYCTGLEYHNVELHESRQHIDLDAWVSNVNISGCNSIRSVRDRTRDDCVWEFNGTKNVIMTGCVTHNGNRGVVVSNKSDLYKSWSLVIAHKDDRLAPIGDVATCIWDNLTFRSNTWRNLSYSGMQIGSDWNAFPHPNEQLGANLIVEDTFIDCAWNLGPGTDNAIVNAKEVKRGRILPRIFNPSAFLTNVTTAVTDYDLDDDTVPDVFSIVVNSVGVAGKGIAVGEDISIVYDSGGPREYFIGNVVSIVGTTVTFDRALTWTVAAGNSVMAGPGKCYGVWGRSFVDADVVGTVTTTLQDFAFAGQDFIRPVTTAGLSIGASLKVTTTPDNDDDDPVFVAGILNVSGGFVYLDDVLPWPGNIGQAVVQESVTGATAASDFSAEIGGIYEDLGREAVYVSRPSAIQFARLVARNCGRHHLIGKTRQIWMHKIDARAAQITGNVDVRATTGDIQDGVLFQSETWADGAFRVELNGSHIEGHTEYDLYISDSINTNESMGNFYIDAGSCYIPKTSINLNGASPIGFNRPSWMTGPSYPLGTSGRNHAHIKGEVVLNTAANKNDVWGWWCDVAGKAGTWDEMGRLGPPLPFPLDFMPPRYAVSTTQSPALNFGNQGSSLRWTGGQATQDKGSIQFMCPRGLEGARTIKAMIIGTSTAEDIIIKTDKVSSAAGGAGTFTTTNSTEQTTINVGASLVIVTLASVTLVAGQVYKIAFKPRTPADANIAQTKDFLAAWIE